MMSLLKTFHLPAAVLLAVSAGSMATAQETALDGAMLFKTKACFSCHGADGRTPIQPLYPKVAGQNAAYTYNQLRDIKNGARSNGQTIVMKGIMATVTEEEMTALAGWLSTQ